MKIMMYLGQLKPLQKAQSYISANPCLFLCFGNNFVTTHIVLCLSHTSYSTSHSGTQHFLPILQVLNHEAQTSHRLVAAFIFRASGFFHSLLGQNSLFGREENVHFANINNRKVMIEMRLPLMGFNFIANC